MNNIVVAAEGTDAADAAGAGDAGSKAGRWTAAAGVLEAPTSSRLQAAAITKPQDFQVSSVLYTNESCSDLLSFNRYQALLAEKSGNKQQKMTHTEVTSKCTLLRSTVNTDTYSG